MPDSAATKTILFAGGGTGGHIFPNLAVVERLREVQHETGPWEAHFVVSRRPLDRTVLEDASVRFMPLAVRPLTSKPWCWPRWVSCWRRSVRDVQRLLRTERVAAVVATGGFVSGPVVVAAVRLGVPVALVNLDAVPGKTNRALARRCESIFTVYPQTSWPEARSIGLPLRRSAVATADAASSRKLNGLDPDRPTLLVLGGSQGATTLNLMIRPLLADTPKIRDLLTRWQVLHVAGRGEGVVESLERIYAEAAVPARVLSFCSQMGPAWGAATLAISRAGAGSVAEAWANTVPTIFLPYPFHSDQHQKLNAEPLVRAGGALILEDRIEPSRNAQAAAAMLAPLLDGAAKRDTMRQTLGDSRPQDGAAAVARWLQEKMDRPDAAICQ